MKNITSEACRHRRCLGGGGYGIVVDASTSSAPSAPLALNVALALKLFRDVNSCEKLSMEVKIQKLAYELGIKTPKIIEHFDKKIIVNIEGVGTEFLCGILMEKIEPLIYGVQFHILLNKNVDTDIDTIVYTNDSPRGFYGSPELLEAMFNDLKNGDASDIIFFHSKYLKMGFKKYIQNIAYQMGVMLQTMVKGKIRPIDVEFIIDKYGDLWMIDFGLCEFHENQKLQDFLDDKSWRGLYNDMYIPNIDSELRQWFNEGTSSTNVVR